MQHLTVSADDADLTTGHNPTEGEAINDDMDHSAMNAGETESTPAGTSIPGDNLAAPASYKTRHNRAMKKGSKLYAAAYYNIASPGAVRNTAIVGGSAAVACYAVCQANLAKFPTALAVGALTAALVYGAHVYYPKHVLFA